MTLLQVVAASQNRPAFHLTGHLRPPFLSRLPDRTRRTTYFRTDTSEKCFSLIWLQYEHAANV